MGAKQQEQIDRLLKTGIELQRERDFYREQMRVAHNRLRVLQLRVRHLDFGLRSFYSEAGLPFPIQLEETFRKVHQAMYDTPETVGAGFAELFAAAKQAVDGTRLITHESFNRLRYAVQQLERGFE
jgi:hypothetical protein